MTFRRSRSAARTGGKYRDKVRRSLDVFARMLRERRFEAEPAAGRAGDRAEPGRRARRAVHAQRRRARRRSPTRPGRPSSGQFNLEINVPPRQLDGDALDGLETRGPRQPQRARTPGPAAPGSRLVMIGILPTLARAATCTRTRCRPTRATSCSTSRSSRPAARTCGSRSTAPSSCSPTPTASPPRPPAPACSCTSRSARTRSPSYWNAAQAIAGRAGGAGRQLAVPVRQAALARDQDHAVRAGHRHPAGRAEGSRACGPGCGSASAGSPRCSTCSRRTSGTSRRCCRSARTRTRWRCWTGGALPQLAELSLHNGTVYRWNRPVYAVVGRHAAPAGGEPGAAGRPDGRRHHGQRGVLLRPGPRRSPRRSGRSGPRCRSPPPRRTCTRPPGTAWTPSSTGRAWARRRWPSWSCAACCRWPARAWPAGAWTPSCADRLLGIIEQRCLTGRNGAAWQIATVDRLSASGVDRREALRQMTLRYIEHMHTNEPVHTWSVGLGPA